jgi:catechol-2,3-dioxygenase
MTTPSLSISHAGFHVFDMEKMVKFFTEVYGLHVTDRGVMGERGEIVFLGADPRDHHQLVMYGGRTATEGVHYNHISFRADGVDRLREIHAKLHDYPGVTRVSTINHGNAWAVYCYDPEGNRTEVFVDSPWHVSQPYESELNLSLSDQAIADATTDMLKNDATAKPFAQWRQEKAVEFGLV